MGIKANVTRWDRRYTALMLLAAGAVVAVVLWVFEMSTALVVSVFVAFVVAAGIAFVKRQPPVSSDRQSAPPRST